jgi:hypothetical protein
MATCKSISNCLKKFIESNPKPYISWYGCYKYEVQGVTECKCWKKVIEGNNFDYFIHDMTNENSEIDFSKYLVEVKKV